MFLMHSEKLYAADSGAGTGGTPDGAGSGSGDQQPDGMSGAQSSVPTFEQWYTTLDAQTKGLVDRHVAGLKTALLTERQEKSALAQQLKALAARADKGSELEKQLNAMQATLQAAERRAAFVEDALRPEVGCISVRAAYALAVADDLFDRQGRPDWNALRTAAPELFRKPGAGSADGAGGGQQQPHLDMNTIIRRAAGRR